MLSLIATQFKVQKELSIIYYFWYIHYLFKLVFVLLITDTIKSSTQYLLDLRKQMMRLNLHTEKEKVHMLTKNWIVSYVDTFTDIQTRISPLV